MLSPSSDCRGCLGKEESGCIRCSPPVLSQAPLAFSIKNYMLSRMLSPCLSPIHFSCMSFSSLPLDLLMLSAFTICVAVLSLTGIHRVKMSCLLLFRNVAPLITNKRSQVCRCCKSAENDYLQSDHLPISSLHPLQL